MRALVVDDEPAIRTLTARALAQEGFRCDVAADGLEAAERLRETKFDLMVTDLAMPNRHGHSLVVDVLGQPDRPVIVVLTGLQEPKMVKDLLRRGIEDVLLKPIDYRYLSAKASALVRRRAEHQDPATPAGDQGPRVAPRLQPISLAEFENRLGKVHHLLPLSQVALDVLGMVRAEDCDARTVAELIQRDSVLSAELLRLGNSAFYNAGLRRVVSVEEAVVRIGLKHVGEVALAMSALGGLTAQVLPWLDKELAWQRSLAAGMAMNRILERTRRASTREGLVLSALMHPLGRVVLGTIYHDAYHDMIAACGQDLTSLRQQERQVFPASESAAMALVLARWGVPAEVYYPLKYIAEGFAELPRLSEPVRSKVELLKIAIVLGEFAVGRWVAWDHLEFPPGDLLSRHGLDDAGLIIDEIRADLINLPPLQHATEGANDGAPVNAITNARLGPLPYGSLSSEPYDFLRQLLGSSGYEVRPQQMPEEEWDANLMLNGYKRRPRGWLRTRRCAAGKIGSW